MLDEAKGEFQKEIENNSYNDMTYCMLGMIDFAKGNLKEAEVSWKKALEINKDNKIAQQCIDNYLKKGQR